MTDTEQVKQISELITRKVLDGFKKQLPCNDMQKMVHEHNSILNNGLRDDVAEIKEQLKTQAENKEVGRKTFWRGFGIAIAATIVSLFLREILPKIFGG